MYNPMECGRIDTSEKKEQKNYQAKVDKYKEAKKNRKKQMKKEKRQSYLRRGVACIVAAALIGMAGFSIYNIYESKQPKQEVTVDYSAIASLSQSLSDNGTSAE